MAAESTSPTARLFVAIWLPEPVAEHLSQGLQEALDHFAPSDPAEPAPDLGLRVTRRDTWHLTLAFLGQVPVDRTASHFLRIQLRGTAQDGPGRPRTSTAGDGSLQPGALALRGAGTFGPTAWVGVDHGPWLAGLAESVQRTLHVADRRFRAHVTVARARQDRVRAREFAQTLRDYRGPQWLPDELLLVESVLGPVPRYPVRARLPLPQVAI